MSYATGVGVPGNGAPAAAARALVVRMAGIHKAFDGVQVLDDIDFEVLLGEVHALAGGNGAGKSTFMKILQGVYSCDVGTIDATGRIVPFVSIHDVKRAGIGMIFQEFSLVSTLTVAQNILLNAEPRKAGLIDDRVMVERVWEIFKRMQISADPERSFGTFSTAYRQLTEIAKTLLEDARALIMDEPTASLARHEAQALFDLIGRLKDQGIAVIYISYRMEGVYMIADRVTILRNGERLLTQRLTDIMPAQIAEGIVGKEVELADNAGQPSTDGSVVLRAAGLASSSGIHGVDLVLRAGQAVGLTGLMGSGRSELARAFYGVDRITAGMLSVDGRAVSSASPAGALRHGTCLIPEDRRLQGLILDHPMAGSLMLPHLGDLRAGPLVDDKAASELVNILIDDFAIKAADPDASARLLSGGNQQKIVITKWISRTPRVLIMDEPTAGVDVGTKTEIITTVRSYVNQGMAAPVISSEYPELFAMNDRLSLICDSTIVCELDRSSITDKQALELEV